MSARSLYDVLNAMTRDGLLDAAGMAKAEEVMQGTGPATPWYLRVMTGFGAWLAAVFLIGFLLLSDSMPPMVVFGLVLVGGAILLRRLDRGDFLNQLALAASLVGQVLVLVGALFELNMHGAAATALLMLLMQILLISFYDDQTHRLLSTLAAVGALEVLFFDWNWGYAPALLSGVLGLISIHLWLKETDFLGLERTLRPIAYGLVLAMLALLLPSILLPAHDYGLVLAILGLLSPSIYLPMSGAFSPLDGLPLNLWLTTGLLGAGLLYLVHRLIRERGQPPSGAFALSTYGAVLLLIWVAQRAPGLIGALIVLLLGFRRGNRLLIGIALFFLAVFLVGYYYNLSLSLLLKSVALVGSGAVLLALRWVLLTQLPERETHHAQ